MDHKFNSELQYSETGPNQAPCSCGKIHEILPDNTVDTTMGYYVPLGRKIDQGSFKKLVEKDNEIIFAHQLSKA